LNAALLAASHYLGAMVLYACLVTEYMLLQPQMDGASLRKLVRIDLIFGLAALVQLITGVSRVFVEKGSAYYLANPLFHVKITLYVAIGLLLIFPTMRILAWGRAAKAAGGAMIVLDGYKRAIMMIRAELLLLTLIPVFASLIARGFGAHVG
jgi:putative membrane protein